MVDNRIPILKLLQMEESFGMVRCMALFRWIDKPGGILVEKKKKE